MTAAVVGVIGHVDHGKTALVRALTGVDTDRLEEEKRRGISIALGFAVLRTAGAVIDLVDMPGHERFVRTMISGATGLDGVLVVIDANEGIRPQTREHLDIARLIGIHRGVVALTKVDIARREQIAEHRDAINSLLESAGFSPMPMIVCSAQTGEGLSDLAGALDELARNSMPRADCGFAYLPIDRVFAVPGFGPVVTGTLRRSSLAVGDDLELVPVGLRAKARNLQIHGEPVRKALPGRRTAVAVRGVELGDLRRGMAIATPGTILHSTWIDVVIRVLGAGPRALENGQQLRLLFGTTEVGARLRLLEQGALEPGQDAVAQLHCAEDIAVPAREPFILRLASPPMTVAGGTVLAPAARRRRRGQVPQHLVHLASGNPDRAIAAFLKAAGTAGVGLNDIAQMAGLADSRIASLLPPSAVRLARDLIIDERSWQTLRQSVLARLAELHRNEPLQPGHSREMLRNAAAPGDVLDAVVNRLVVTGEIVCERGLFRLRDFDPVAMPPSASHLVSEIERAFLAGGLMPPDIHAVTTGDSRYAALRWLIHAGTLVRTMDRVQQREIVFHRQAVERAADLVRERLDREEGFLAREAGVIWGVSRKYSIPLLEHFDATGLTRREGDRRFVVAARLERESHLADVAR